MNKKELIFKATSINDIDLILKLDKQEKTQRYLGGIKNKTKEERISFLKKKELNKIAYTVCLDDIKIGFIELKEKENNTGELSYIFDCDYWNRGFCTEAIHKILKIGFKKMRLASIYAYTVIDNGASRKVLEKNGFILMETIVRDNIRYFKYVIAKDDMR